MVFVMPVGLAYSIPLKSAISQLSREPFLNCEVEDRNHFCFSETIYGTRSPPTSTALPLVIWLGILPYFAARNIRSRSLVFSFFGIPQALSGSSHVATSSFHEIPSELLSSERRFLSLLQLERDNDRLNRGNGLVCDVELD